MNPRCPVDPSSEDYRFGIHSNIPECCVRFFVQRTNTQRVRLNARRGASPARYVMCTTCWRRSRAGQHTPNALHICRDSHDDPLCHEFLSWPDRNAGRPVQARYVVPRVTAGDMAFVDALLLECGYEKHTNGTTVRYTHDAWESVLTYPSDKQYVPAEELDELVLLLERKLGTWLV